VFANPPAGATVSGATTVTLLASGGTGYTYSASVDGQPLFSGTNPSFSWNTAASTNGSHTLTATVVDSLNRVATASRTVTVANVITPPPPPTGASFTVSFSYPSAGAAVSGSQTVGMATTATWGQAKTFTLSVDGTVVTSQTATGTTLWQTWDTTGVPNGARTLTASVTMNGQTASASLPVVVANGASSPFADVALGNPFWTWIQAVTAAGIASGCGGNPPQYCPQDSVTRAQMAVLLLRGMAYPSAIAPPSPTGAVFADVPASYPLAGWVEGLFAARVTAGCGSAPLRYCPDAPVTRGEMAVFLLRAKHGAGYLPPAGGQPFADVPAGDPFGAWIAQLAAEGVTGGCATSPARYCPDDPVTRAEMAVFLVRTFGLPS
jgi:hypothetical protein